MSDGRVATSVDESGVAELVIDRPDARNALSAHLALGITEAATALNGNAAVRVVIVRSSCPDFYCVGADLKERAHLDEAGLMAVREHSAAATRALLGIEVPVIAAISGPALGGGLELALTCDIIVADATALIGLPETGVGIIPGGGGTQLLPRRIGTGRAAELILTGRRLDAGEAHRYGIVDHLAADALTAAHQLAVAIATKSTTAQRHAKSSLRQGQGLTLPEALAVEDHHWRESARSADYREGLAAFGSKRPPRWPDSATSRPTSSDTDASTGGHL